MHGGATMGSYCNHDRHENKNHCEEQDVFSRIESLGTELVEEAGRFFDPLGGREGKEEIERT